MADRDASPVQLAVEADLTIEVDGSLSRLTGSGQTLRLDCASLQHLVSSGPPGSGAGGLDLDRLGAALATVGLTVEIAENGYLLARLGRVKRSLLGRVAARNRYVDIHRPGHLMRALGMGSKR